MFRRVRDARAHGRGTVFQAKCGLPAIEKRRIVEKTESAFN
jgi:hypothetical protein